MGWFTIRPSNCGGVRSSRFGFGGDVITVYFINPFLLTHTFPWSTVGGRTTIAYFPRHRPATVAVIGRTRERAPWGIFFSTAGIPSRSDGRAKTRGNGVPVVRRHRTPPFRQLFSPTVSGTREMVAHRSVTLVK